VAFVRADEFQFGFLLLSSSSVFQLGFGSGRTFFKFPNIAKPCSLAVIMTYQHSEYIEFTIKQSNEVCNYLYGKELTITQTFCLGLIERLNNSSKTIKLLIKKLNTEPSHEYSIGIIVRALLLDSLVGMNLYKIYTDSLKNKDSESITNEKVSLYCEINLSDGISKTLSYLDDAKKFNFIDEEQLKLAFNNIAVTKAYFLESHLNDGTKPILRHNKYYSPQKLFELLASDSGTKNAARMYDAYLYFSKYDHFGITYYEIIRIEKSIKDKNYLEAFEGIVFNLSFLILILKTTFENDTFFTNKEVEVNKYLKKVV
jgi:hypothetical protein